jgi:type IV pilus assembly protein PilQ
MKRAIRWTGLVFFGIILTAAFQPAWGAPPATPDASPQAVAGYLENVSFEKLPGKERVILTVSKQSGMTIENQPGNAIAVRLENLFVPEELRRPLSDQGLVNVVRVTPVQKTAGGRSWVLATVEMKQKVPYSVRQEGMSVLIDFNISSLALAPAPIAEKPLPPQPPVPAAAKLAGDTVKTAVKTNGEEIKVYTGARIFLDVQDADIKAVFRLLAEQGKVSIVSGDDVKGPVSLNLKDVPWDQALDTVLDLKGLAKKQEGNIITIVTLDRKKKDDTDRVSAEESQRKAEDERKTREQKQNVEQGKLKKIAIEAKIVEVTTNYARQLGIRWGYGYRDTWNNRDLGLLIGSSASGTLTNLPTGLGLTSSNAAVNFPALTGADALTPGIGIIAGSAQFILDAKLSALENSGDGKVISSPKVTTLENEKATIWQGKKVPVVTPATSTAPATVRYEDADLRLVVTPKITQDQDRISMEIDASNKDVDNSLVVMGNPAINTSGVTSKIVVRDGDTIVVGGVYKTVETFATAGVPFFSKIPILGWLFKYETKTQETREILIFITPRIIKDVT